MFNGFHIIKNAITSREIDTLLNYLAIMKNTGNLKGNTDGKTAHMYYALPYFEAMLSSFTPVVSEIVGERVYPSYSFLWNYKKGHCVPKHRDRDSVDYIISININNKNENDWPIYVDGERVNLKSTEALVLDGKKLTHWREKCPYQNRLQLILCFTREEDRLFDRREHLGFDPIPEVITSPFKINLTIDDDVVLEKANDRV